MLDRNLIFPSFQILNRKTTLLKFLTQNFRASVTDYLVKNYLSDSVPFNPTYCSYFYDINLLSEFNTANISETINKRLKGLCGTGFLPFKTSCTKLTAFKTNYLQDYKTKVRNDNLNDRRRRTKDRESVLLRLIYQFHDLTFMEQSDINSKVNYAFKLGNVNSYCELRNFLNLLLNTIYNKKYKKNNFRIIRRTKNL